MPDLDGFRAAIVTGLVIDGNHEFPPGQRRLGVRQMGTKLQNIEAGRLTGAALNGTIQLTGYPGELGDF